jgi:hypothetical protein
LHEAFTGVRVWDQMHIPFRRGLLSCLSLFSLLFCLWLQLLFLTKWVPFLSLSQILFLLLLLLFLSKISIILFAFPDFVFFLLENRIGPLIHCFLKF